MLDRIRPIISLPCDIAARLEALDTAYPLRPASIVAAVDLDCPGPSDFCVIVVRWELGAVCNALDKATLFPLLRTGEQEERRKDSTGEHDVDCGGGE